MIAHIRGTLTEKDPARVVLEAAGVGYEVFIPLSTYDRLPHTGEETKLLTVHVVREDDEILFGFATSAEREMFAKLTTVSGVGPRIALAILSGLTVGDLGLAITSGNAKRIASVKGVGKKTAEKICVELKDKVSAIEALATAGKTTGGDRAYLRDAILALCSLGFAEEVASQMAARAVESHPDVADAQTLIRLALAQK